MKKSVLFCLVLLSFVLLKSQQNDYYNDKSHLFKAQEKYNNKEIKHSLESDKFFHNQVNKLTAGSNLDSVIKYNFITDSDSIRYHKGIYTFTDSGNWGSDTNWLWNQETEIWEYSEMVNYYFGNDDLMDSTYIYEWGKLENLWIKSRKYLEDYDEQGNRTEVRAYKWNTEFNTWNKYSKSQRTWDINGMQTAYISFNANEDDEWVPSYANEHQYDQNSNRILSIGMSWDEVLGEWVNNSKQESFYGMEDLKDSTLYYFWESSSIYKNKKDILPEQKIEGAKKFNDGFWILDYKDELYYNENGLVSVLYGYWTENEIWKLGSKREYEYDEKGNTILFLSSNWVKQTETWKKLFKWEREYTYEFDEYGDVTLSEDYDWNEDSQKWVGRIKYEYTFNEEGRYLQRIRSDWNELTEYWQFDYKDFFYRSLLTDVIRNTGVSISIYPNPVSDDLNIVTRKSSIDKCTVLSQSGQVLLNKRILDEKTILNVSKLSPGVYYLKLSSNDFSTVQQFIKR